MHTFTKLLLAGGLALLGSQAAQAQQLLDNFENTRLLDYPSPQGTISVVANPSATAPNTSSTVGKYDRDGSQQYATVSMQLKNNVKFASVAAYVAGTKQIRMLFRNPAGTAVQVQLVLQNRAKAIATPYTYPQGNYSGVFNATTTTATGWQQLVFTYAGAQSDGTVTATDIDQIAMLVAGGTNSALTYYFDDVTGPEVGTTSTPTVVTDQVWDNYEGTRAIKYNKSVTSGGFRADSLAPTLTPAASGNHVFRYSRSNQQYDVLFIAPRGAAFADVSPFLSNAKQMTLRLWSPAANTLVQITLQDSTRARGNYPAGRHSEYQATTTVANGWQTLVFSFVQRPDGSVSNTSCNEAVLLIAPNTTTTGKYYLDDWTGPHLVGYVAGTRQVATDAALLANPYPNPTSTGLARLPFSLKHGASISLDVYDNLGRRVAQVIDTKSYPAGDHAADIATSRLAPGLYTCRLTVDGTVLSRQLSVE